MVSPHGTTPLTFSPASARAFPDEKNWRPRRDLRVAIGAATLIVSGLLCTPAGATLTPDEATPTTNTDVSSFVATGCGYDAWTGSARRVVHDIFPVAGSIAAGGLKIDRTYSSHNNALEQPDSPRSPGQQYVAARLSYSWSLRGLDGINDPIDIYVVHFPDGRVEGFHSPDSSGIPGDTAWRSGFGTKERLVFPNGTSGIADLYLEDGSVVHFDHYIDFIEQTPPGDGIHPLNYLFDVFTPTGVTDPQGLLTTFTMEQIPGTFEAYDKRLKTVTDPSGQSLAYIYGANGGCTQITASDGQWVIYSPSYEDALTVTYSDGTSASYTYDEITTTDPDTGNPGTPVLVWKTARDTRAEGPMQSIQYSSRSNPPPKFGGEIISEQHYPDGIPVSTFTSDDARTTATDTRGDGPSRTLFMSKEGKTPLMRWKNDFDGIPEYFYYDGYNYLHSFTDRRGASTVYDNEAILGRPTTITHPAAFDGSYTTSTEVRTYSFQGVVSTSNPYFVASVKNERAYTTFYDRDNLNRITQIRYPDGGTETFQYNGRGRVTRHKRGNNFYEFADYDTSGKLTTLWNPVNSSTNPRTQPKTTFSYYPAGNAWAGRVQTVTDPLNHATTYEYDLSFDGNGNQTTTPCPGRGLVTKITHGVDATYKSFRYDSFGNKLSETDETGVTTSFTYDDYNRPKSMAVTGQAATTYDYTATNGASSYSHTSNAVRFETSPSAVETERTYDANLRKVSETPANGATGVEATTLFDYDENGNQTTVTDPRYMAGYPGDYTTVTAYDSRNRKISVTSPGPLGYETDWQYDPAGNVTQITRPDGGVETKTYDSMNRVLSDKTPKDAGTFSTTSFLYNPSGTLQQVTDGNLQVTTFEYNNNADGVGNGFDLKDKITYQDGSYETWTYDANKNVRSRRTSAGDVQTFAYDDLRDRMTGMNWGGQVWGNGVTYDNTYSYDGAGRILTANNGVSLVTRTYDEAGRLETDSETFVNSGLPSHTVQYVHRDDGNVTSVQVDPTDPADPYHFLSTYDEMGRLQTLMNVHDTGKDYEYVYDHASNVIQRFNWLGGGQVFCVFDNLSRMTQRDIKLQNGTVWSSEHYGFDQMNRETSVTRDEDGSADTFSYNYSGELTSAQYGSGGPTPTPTPTPTATPLPKAAMPVFTPASSSAGGHPPTSLSVTITTATSGASIHYTTNNTIPSSTVGTLYTGPVTIAAGTSVTLKAVAYKTGYTTSDVTSALFDRTDHAPKAVKPVFNPSNSTGAHPATNLTVTVSTTSTGTQLRWTNDGSTPTPTHGNFINGSTGTIIVYANTSVTLKVMAYGAAYFDSDVASALFDRTDHAPYAANPVFSPPSSNGASPPSNLTVTISTASSGATMRYTKDGSTPSQTNGVWINGTSGTTTILASTSVTLKAIAYGAAYKDSGITSALFDRVDHTTTCVAPVFNQSGCSGFTGGLLPVTISTTTSGAKMRYTENGANPSDTVGTLIDGTSGTVWIGTVVPITLKAIAYKSGSYNSPITSGYYDNEDPGGGGHAPGHDGSRQRSANQATSARLVNYTLDNCGNRTQVVDAGVSKSYVVNNLNQYTTGHGVAVTNGSSHEISAYNGTSYQYIGDSYPAKATAGTNTYTLFYDALGRCVKRTTVLNGGAPTTNYYLFDGEHWVMEYDVNGTNISNVLYGREMDEVIARGVNGQGWFYFPDRNGNISVVTDGVNTVRESYRYDAFGLPTVTVGSGQTAIGNRFLFTGREWNPTFGFYEYRARAYNPTIGRFMSEDPKGFEGGDYNLYRYCHNDPWDLTDPMGLDDTWLVIHRDSNGSATYDSRRDAPGTLSVFSGSNFQSAHFLFSSRVNEYGYEKGTHGIHPGSYNVLPRTNATEKDHFKNGTPGVTAPGEKVSGDAGHGFHNVYIHAKGDGNGPDSRGCPTVSAEAAMGIKKLVKDSEKTTLTVFVPATIRVTQTGSLIPKVIPVAVPVEKSQ